MDSFPHANYEGDDVNAIDQLMSGEEAIVRVIAEDHGILEAERFVELFNNACFQFAGFEDTLSTILHSRSYIIAPITNLSHQQH